MAAELPLDQLLTDPDRTLARARAERALGDAGIGPVALRYDDVRRLLTDDRLSSSFTGLLHDLGITGGSFHDWMAASPLDRDGEDHKAFRALMSRAFTPRQVDALRPYLRRLGDELAAELAAAGAVDFVVTFADVFPMHGLCELIGVPDTDRDRFRGWATTIGLGFNPVELAGRIDEVDAALDQLLAYTGALVDERTAAPRDDLVSRVAAAEAAGEVPVGDAARYVAGMVFAGHETTRNQLGWMIDVLAAEPEVWDAVGTGELEPKAVVEEVLRFRSAVNNVGRLVDEPIEVGGEAVPAGSRLLLSLRSADRDERAWDRADAFDPAGHAEVPHVAFGHGPHHCLGAALARAELQEALAALTAALRCPELLDGATWKPPVGISGPERLPVRFSAR